LLGSRKKRSKNNTTEEKRRKRVFSHEPPNTYGASVKEIGKPSRIKNGRKKITPSRKRTSGVVLVERGGPTGTATRSNLLAGQRGRGGGRGIAPTKSVGVKRPMQAIIRDVGKKKGEAKKISNGQVLQRNEKRYEDL